MFGKTGCLITADETDNDKIKPEDVPKYHVPPPYDTEATSALPETTTCEPAATPDNLQVLEDVIDVCLTKTYTKKN